MTGMDALSPKARALIERSQAALRAKPGDRERIEAALRTQLGTAALPATESVARISNLARWKVVSGAAIGAVMLGGAAFWAVGSGGSVPQPRAAESPRSAAPSPATPSTPTPVDSPAIAAPSPAKSVAAPKGEVSRVRAPAQDELAREVALLARATQELRAGDAEKALRTLETHRRKYPNGLLEQERRSARAQALCTLGRVAEGRAEQQQLEERSPAASRATQVCDAAAAARDSR
jgi:hypothetical protein